LSHYFRKFIALATPVHAHVCIVSPNGMIYPNGFALHDMFYSYHVDDEIGFCSLCALKAQMEESIQSPGSVLVPARFKNNLSSILLIDYMFPLLYLSLVNFLHTVNSLTRFTRIISSFYTRTTRGCT
jgi:hypothetical protein